jgi:hypothetical protein
MRGSVGLYTSLALIVGVVAGGPAAAEGLLRIPILDDLGHDLTGGQVLFCPKSSDCIAFDIASGGVVDVDRDRLREETVYDVLVYAGDGSLRFAAHGWVYGRDAADADPRLAGLPEQGLSVVVPPPPVTAPAIPADAYAERRYPRWCLAVTVPFMLGGGFGTSDDALGGVSDVSPGIALAASHRGGFPTRRNLGRSSVTFRELSLTYAQNRYQTEPLQATDAGSDLTFHRFLLSAGLGRLWQRGQGTIAVAAGYGGVYDGSSLLEFNGRSYGMFGLGLQVRYLYRVLGGEDGLALGLAGQGELLYWFADQNEVDHFYGWAPSVAVGLAVY